MVQAWNWRPWSARGQRRVSNDSRISAGDDSGSSRSGRCAPLLHRLAHYLGGPGFPPAQAHRPLSRLRPGRHAGRRSGRRAGRWHAPNALTGAPTRTACAALTLLEEHITAQTQLAEITAAAIARRQDTRGDAFTMTVDGRRYRKRADAGQHVLAILREEAAIQLGYRQRTIRAGELGGFTLTVTISQALGQVRAAPALDGAPGTEIPLTQQELASTDPVGLITRLENRLGQLETVNAKALADIEHSRAEIQHATADLAKPFPQAAELAAARQRAHEIDEAIEAAAQSEQRHITAGTPPTSPGPRDSTPPGPSAGERQTGQAPLRSDMSSPNWDSAVQRGPAPRGSRVSERFCNSERPLAGHEGEEREACP
jgi:hypothetical protein